MNSSAPAAWAREVDADGIAWLTFDKPGTSTNVLSRDALLELDSHLKTLASTKLRGLVIRSAKKSGFVAGADVKEFVALENEAQGVEMVRGAQKILDALEALPCPTVAIIHGFALGGGFELALACRYRVGIKGDNFSVGLPEVMLGIHPGFGGTVRAVRIGGVRAAMQMMLTGKALRADQARRAGFVDRLVFPADAEAAARELIARQPKPRKAPLLDRILSLPLLRRVVRRQLLAQVRGRARPEHYPSPYAIIDLWSRYGARGERAYVAEAQSIARLMVGETSRNLVRVFLLQDRLKNLGGKAKVPLARVHVVGAGVMGGDIAAWCAQRGLNVTLQDRELKFIQPALVRAREGFEKRYKDPGKAAELMTRITADVAGDGVPGADVVIEAIFEDVKAKHELFARLEPRMNDNAILASNTSSIMLEQLDDNLPDPGRLVGIHFFNPVAQMPLVEIVRGEATSEDAVQKAIAFTRRIDKLPLPCKSAPGFLVNRVLVPYLYEAMFALQDGIPIETIDEAALRYGMPMGPVELADVVGLDVCKHVGDIVSGALGKQKPDTSRLDALIAAKKLGRKSGEGFYVWKDGKAVKSSAKPAPPPADLEDRLILALANECAAVLRERIVADADLIDAGVIFGSGFAPFRGGPLTYARKRGVDAVVARLTDLARAHGPRFTPDEGWSELRAGA
ncbi:MAG TPA: 3-hydroxyacyl-CoA dehydrogenase NAD-binding domain-containing protein [Steroidobacteraceae bacterium]|jgi:3-hydroxyacyl-CoA dehydrogenase/enoyl-CoA hydratase/3-hydroxybutyryl-CoA epimerase|nr:3-hydroxyacyl-CoA dehydrogenase NAD-binding domain-containing protein [Steroidobacteraceae bacterium]